jgi:hypothetical protein
MSKRPILTIIFASLAMIVSLSVSILSNEHLQVSLFNKTIAVLEGSHMESMVRIDPEAYSFSGTELPEDMVFLGKYGEYSWCQYEQVEHANYEVDLLSVDMPESVEAGEVFMVSMTWENTGSARLYSADSGCYEQPVLNLGTRRETDRTSRFGTEDSAISGWIAPNRIKMAEDDYVDPGETFTIQFQSVAPEEDNNIYREFFRPVVEDLAWIDETFALDIVVGEPSEEDYDNISFVTMLAIDAASLRGLERNLDVDLTTQTLYAKFGDLAVWDMLISSGHWETPTPVGDYTIFQKQELRIGGQYPHYHMPYWQFWDARGYGIHDLPYLPGDGNSFWKEAVEHLGTPVSHGCIRVGDGNAEILYDFTIIGTPVHIYYS